MLVSPDGLLTDYPKCPSDLVASPAHFACEFKCPAPTSQRHRILLHYQLPVYYVCQVLAEMAALEVENLLFICYGKQSSTAFRASFDSELWVQLLHEAAELYYCEKPKRPSRKSEFSKVMQERLQKYTSEKVEFLGEFPSREVKSGVDANIFQVFEDSPYVFAGIDSRNVQRSETMKESLIATLEEMKECTKTMYNLCRRKASEVVVWLLQDVNRQWKSESPHSIPIAYALKGYSLPVDVMRNMSEEVLKACVDKNIHVVGMSFDGQWVGLLSRSADGKPLTQLQLQKDIWGHVKSIEKCNLLTTIEHIGKINASNMIELQVQTSLHQDLESSAIIISSKKNIFALLKQIQWKKLTKLLAKKKSKPTQEVDNSSSSTQGDIGWLPAEALEEIEANRNAGDYLIHGELCAIEAEVDDVLLDSDPNELCPGDTATDEACLLVNDDQNVLYGEDDHSSLVCLIGTDHDAPDAQADTHSSEVVSEEHSNNHGIMESTSLDVNAFRSEQNMASIHHELSERSVKWKGLPVSAVQRLFSDSDIAKNLNELTNKEIDVIVQETRGYQMKHGIRIAKSWPKCRKANALAEVAKDLSHTAPTGETTPHSLNPGIRLCDEDITGIHIRLSQLNDQWNQLPRRSVEDLFTDNVASKLNALPKVELDAVVDATQAYQARASRIIAKSWPKYQKANTLSDLFGNGTHVYHVPTQKKSPGLLSLSKLAFKVITAFPKPVLNAIVAVFTYQNHFEDWLCQSPVGHKMSIQGITEERDWFSYPETHGETSQPIAKCLDGHHLFVNLRVRICKDGVQGVRKEAWHKVAEHDHDIISKSLVVDLIDKQRNSYARRTFSVEVEQCMRDLGYEQEANFTKLVREWYQAEDDRAIPALQRAKQRLAFRDELLNGVSFGSFPPHGMYIKGFPQVMYEGFLSSIDSHMQLYTQCREGSYNQRSFSSLENETFFGSLSELDPTRLGCSRAVNVNRLMANIAEVQHYRQDPDSR